MSNFSVKNLSRSKMNLLRLTLILVNVDVMACAGVVNPAMGVFTQAFPDANPSMISLIATIIAFVMIPTGLISGKLCEIYNKKYIALVGFVFYIIGGVGPVFSSSLTGILAIRCILGIGAGLLNPISMSMIRDIFDGKERASMMGYAQAGGSIAMIFLQILAGNLAAKDYHLTFLAYAPMIIVPFFAYFFLPTEPFEPKKKEKVTEIQSSSVKEKLPMVLFALAMIAMINGVGIKYYMLRFAVYFMEEGLGSAAVVGSIMMFQTVGMLLSSLIFGKLYAKMRYYLLVGCWAGVAVAIGLLYVYTSIVSCVIAQLLFGFAFASIQPFFYMLISVITPKSRTAMGLAIFQAGLQLAAFVATFFTSFILIFMPKANTRQQLIVPIVMFGTLAIGALILTVVKGNPSTMEAPDKEK